MIHIVEKLSQIYKVDLSIESTQILSSALKKAEYSRNEIILDLNKNCSDFYIIDKGMIRQFYYKDGRDVSEHFSCEYDIVFCVESVFLDEPTSLIIEAIEDSIIYKLNHKSFLKLCDQYNDISRLYRRILELDLVLTQRKADSWRFETSKQRYDRFCIEYPEVVKRASVSHIASYLLMTPETLSRIRANKL